MRLWRRVDRLRPPCDTWSSDLTGIQDDLGFCRQLQRKFASAAANVKTVALRVTPTDAVSNDANAAPAVHDFIGRFADLPIYSTGIDAATAAASARKGGAGADGGVDASTGGAGGRGGAGGGLESDLTKWERGLAHVPPTMMADWDVPRHGHPTLKKPVPSYEGGGENSTKK